MKVVSVLGMVVGILFLIRSWLLIRAKREDLVSLLVWVVIGLGLVVASAVPSVFDYVIGILGMETRAYAMFLVAFLIAYVLLFRLYRAQREMSEEISRLNEELALVRALREGSERRE